MQTQALLDADGARVLVLKDLDKLLLRRRNYFAAAVPLDRHLGHARLLREDLPPNRIDVEDLWWRLAPARMTRDGASMCRTARDR